MTETLKRGHNAVLTEHVGADSTIRLGLGWEPAAAGSGVDVEASALLVGADGTVPSDRHLVFYNNPVSPDGSVRHSGDLEGDAGSDRQVVSVDLGEVPEEIERVVVVVSVYEAEAREQSLADVTGVLVRALDDRDEEVVRYSWDEGSTIETAVVLAEVYRAGEAWKMVAVGEGWASGLRGVATAFGVHV